MATGSDGRGLESDGQDSPLPRPLLHQQYQVYNFGDRAGHGNAMPMGGYDHFYSQPASYYYPGYYPHIPGATATPYCGSTPEGQNQQPQRVPPERPQDSDSGYTYRVRIINPKNKRDFMDLTWHNVSEKFKSVTSLKIKLIDSFPDYVASTPTFQVGYLEGRGLQKRWIVCLADLTKLYESFDIGGEIRLWCEAKGKGVSRQHTIEKDDEPKSKRKKADEQEAEIRAQLEEKHASSYTGPQYTLWAKFIRNGRHESYDKPPPIPLITGQQRGRPEPKKESISDAFVGAANAFANALKTPPPSTHSTPTTPPSARMIHSNGMSPNNQASLRRKYLEDLRMLSQLHDDGVLTDGEFKEQKDTILDGLRKLK